MSFNINIDMSDDNEEENRVQEDDFESILINKIDLINGIFPQLVDTAVESFCESKFASSILKKMVKSFKF